MAITVNKEFLLFQGISNETEKILVYTDNPSDIVIPNLTEDGRFTIAKTGESSSSATNPYVEYTVTYRYGTSSIRIETEFVISSASNPSDSLKVQVFLDDRYNTQLKSRESYVNLYAVKNYISSTGTTYTPSSARYEVNIYNPSRTNPYRPDKTFTKTFTQSVPVKVRRSNDSELSGDICLIEGSEDNRLYGNNSYLVEVKVFTLTDELIHTKRFWADTSKNVYRFICDSADNKVMSMGFRCEKPDGHSEDECFLYSKGNLFPTTDTFHPDDYVYPGDSVLAPMIYDYTSGYRFFDGMETSEIRIWEVASSNAPLTNIFNTIAFRYQYQYYVIEGSRYQFKSYDINDVDVYNLTEEYPEDDRNNGFNLTLSIGSIGIQEPFPYYAILPNWPVQYSEVVTCETPVGSYVEEDWYISNVYISEGNGQIYKRGTNFFCLDVTSKNPNPYIDALFEAIIRKRELYVDGNGNEFRVGRTLGWLQKRSDKYVGADVDEVKFSYTAGEQIVRIYASDINDVAYNGHGVGSWINVSVASKGDNYIDYKIAVSDNTTSHANSGSVHFYLNSDIETRYVVYVDQENDPNIEVRYLKAQAYDYSTDTMLRSVKITVRENDENGRIVYGPINISDGYVQIETSLVSDPTDYYILATKSGYNQYSGIVAASTSSTDIVKLYLTPITPDPEPEPEKDYKLYTTYTNSFWGVDGSLSVNGGTKVAYFYSNYPGPFTISTADNWLTIGEVYDKTPFYNDEYRYSIDITANGNLGGVKREGTVTISIPGKTITPKVSQNGGAGAFMMFFSPGDDTGYVPATGGTLTARFDASSWYTGDWILTPSDSWMTTSTVVSNRETRTFTVNVAENTPGTIREGKITISPKDEPGYKLVYTVSQGAYYLLTSPISRPLSGEGETIKVVFFSNYPGEFDITSENEWVSIGPVSKDPMNGGDAYTFNLTVSKNPGISERTGGVSISIPGVYTKRLDFRQEGLDYSYFGFDIRLIDIYYRDQLYGCTVVITDKDGNEIINRVAGDSHATYTYPAAKDTPESDRTFHYVITAPGYDTLEGDVVARPTPVYETLLTLTLTPFPHYVKFKCNLPATYKFIDWEGHEKTGTSTDNGEITEVYVVNYPKNISYTLTPIDESYRPESGQTMPKETETPINITFIKKDWYGIDFRFMDESKPAGQNLLDKVHVKLYEGETLLVDEVVDKGTYSYSYNGDNPRTFRYVLTRENYFDVEGTITASRYPDTARIYFIPRFKNYYLRLDFFNPDGNWLFEVDYKIKSKTSDKEYIGVAKTGSFYETFLAETSEEFEYTVSKEGYKSVSGTVSTNTTGASTRVILEPDLEATQTCYVNLSVQSKGSVAGLQYTIKRKSTGEIVKSGILGTDGKISYSHKGLEEDFVYTIESEGSIIATGIVKSSTSNQYRVITISGTADSYYVSFNIIDSNNNPVYDAIYFLRLGGASGQIISSGVASSSSMAIDVPSAGTYYYFISKEGYTPAEGTVEASKVGSLTTKNAVLGTESLKVELSSDQVKIPAVGGKASVQYKAVSGVIASSQVVYVPTNLTVVITEKDIIVNGSKSTAEIDNISLSFTGRDGSTVYKSIAVSYESSEYFNVAQDIYRIKTDVINVPISWVGINGTPSVLVSGDGLRAELLSVSTENKTAVLSFFYESDNLTTSEKTGEIQLSGVGSVSGNTITKTITVIQLPYNDTTNPSNPTPGPNQSGSSIRPGAIQQANLEIEFPDSQFPFYELSSYINYTIKAGTATDVSIVSSDSWITNTRVDLDSQRVYFTLADNNTNSPRTGKIAINFYDAYRDGWYEYDLTFTQYGMGSGNMIVIPAWRDTYYEFASSPVEYTVRSGGKTLFTGKAVATPGTTKPRINVSSIFNSYLGCEDLKFGATETVVYNGEDRLFEISTLTGNEISYLVHNDWSYDPSVNYVLPNNNGLILSDPINGHFDYRMYFLFTTFETTYTHYQCNILDENGGDAARGILHSPRFDGPEYYTATLEVASVPTNAKTVIFKDEFDNESVKYDTPVCGHRYALYYRNRKGGFDSFLIEGKASKTDSYGKESVSTVFNNNNLYEFGNRSFHKDIKTKWTLCSGWLSDEQSEKLAFNLLASPQVYLHDLYEGTIKSVNITNSNADYKKYRNERKLFNYQIEVEESQPKLFI